ncbi:hypothetical protein GY45DRAFT_1111208 [Cubamyces sp. BRFM 1775]|nr:hypothetical protein GY45DRAFT_1111208 [Cubamyces sp. BRFM 1775]
MAVDAVMMRRGRAKAGRGAKARDIGGQRAGEVFDGAVWASVRMLNRKVEKALPRKASSCSCCSCFSTIGSGGKAHARQRFYIFHRQHGGPEGTTRRGGGGKSA